MIFSKQMYWGRHASQRKAYILDNLRERHFLPAAYLITEAKAPNLYEIYHSAMLLNPGFDSVDFIVLGIGYGYQDAVECVEEMLKDRLVTDRTRPEETS